jgi:hypothetical protein
LALFLRRRSREKFARRFKVIFANEDLSPSPESSATLDGDVRPAISALDAVRPKHRADHVGLSVAPDNRKSRRSGHECTSIL